MEWRDEVERASHVRQSGDRRMDIVRERRSSGFAAGIVEIERREAAGA